MHAYIGVLADRANVVPKHGQLCSCKHEHGTEECTRVGIVCGSPGVLPCKTVKNSALCQVCRTSSSTSARVAVPLQVVGTRSVLGAGLELAPWSGSATGPMSCPGVLRCERLLRDRARRDLCRVCPP